MHKIANFGKQFPFQTYQGEYKSITFNTKLTRINVTKNVSRFMILYKNRIYKYI